MMDEASPPAPLMGRLLIDSLRHQVATLTKERDGARLVARQMQERVEQALGLIATVTEALEIALPYMRERANLSNPGVYGDVHRQIERVEVALDAVREPIVYVRCACDHPGDNPACEIDHDQIQHERET